MAFDIENQPYIQSQYGASPTIKELLNSFREEIDPAADIEAFVQNVMSIETAKGYGLECWARIVGVKRQLIITGTTTDEPLFTFKGMNEGGFNDGVFVTFDELSSQGKSLVTLNDASFRNLIKFKALANIMDGSVATMNKLAASLLSSTDFIVSNVITQGQYENGDYYNKTPMLIKWTWRANYMSNLDAGLFNAYSEMIVPAGVKYITAVVSKDPLFGFAGSKLNPFGQGAFGYVKAIG